MIMSNNKVWLAFALCFAAVSAVTIKDFKAKQVASSARVLLTWKPSSTPPNLTYKLDYHFLNRKLQKNITSSTAKSTEVLLMRIFCRKADFKLTPLVAGVPGTSVRSSFTFPEGKNFPVDKLTHTTHKHNNNEQISWTVNKKIRACKSQFLVNTYHPWRKFMTNKTDFTLRDLKPNRQYTVKVRHVFSDGSWGPVSSISFRAKYDGSEPEKVAYDSTVSFGKVDLQIQPLWYEKSTPIKYFVVSYVSGLAQTNVEFRTTDRHIPITSYEACRDFTVEIHQVTMDLISSKPSKKMIETLPHTPNKPELSAEYTPGGVKLIINSKPIQGNWLCRKVYEIKARYPDGKVDTTIWTTTEATIMLKMRGKYTFVVREAVDRKAYSPVSEPVEYFFAGK